MNFNKIQRIYKNLPYIIEKDRYLIPHRPKKPLSLFLRIMHFARKQLILQQPEKLTRQFLVQITRNLINDQPEVFAEMQIFHKQQMKLYQEQLKKYSNKYLQPIMNRKSGMSDFSIWKKEMLQKIDKEKRVQAMINSHIAWKDIKNSEKQVYIKKYKQFRSKKTQQFSQFKKIHEIPKILKSVPISRFLSSYKIKEITGNRFTKSFISNYQYISSRKKNFYRKEAKQMSQSSIQNYSKFLQKWNLTNQQLKYLIRINQEYKKAKIKHKIYLKKKKQKELKDQIEQK